MSNLNQLRITGAPGSGMSKVMLSQSVNNFKYGFIMFNLR